MVSKRKDRLFVIFIVALGILLSTALSVKAQDTTTVASDTSYWQKGVLGNLTFSQVSLTNWVAGGNNAISLNSYVGIFFNYAKDRVTWENSIDLAYGLVDQGGLGFRKSDDKINYVTKFGYLFKRKPKLQWSTLVDFRTQFAQGFEFTDDGQEILISEFMAPGYMVISTGLEYKPSKAFSLILAPVTGKLTFVTNQDLANEGAFGVDAAVRDQGGNIITEGKQFRAEIGTFLKAQYKNEIAKNINLDTRLELFTNYVESFGNIDVNWENILIMKVNSWLSTNFITQLLYDDDINIDEFDANGNLLSSVPRVQFRQIFGIGLSITVGDKNPKG